MPQCSGHQEVKSKLAKGKLTDRAKRSKPTTKLKDKKELFDKREQRPKPKQIPIQKIDDTFREALDKFKRLFEDKPSPKETLQSTRYRVDTKVKKSQGSTMATKDLKSKRNPVTRSKNQLSELFLQMQQKLQDYRIKAKAITHNEKKSKSKSRNKNNTARSRSEKHRKVPQSINKSVNLNASVKVQRKRLQTETEPKHFASLVSPFSHLPCKYKQISPDSSFEGTPMDRIQNSSVIVYDLSSGQHHHITLEPFSLTNAHAQISKIEQYIKGFSVYNRRQRTDYSRHSTSKSKNDETVESMIREQQEKWLQLRTDLERLKQSHCSNDQLEIIIKQVEENRHKLQSANAQDLNEKHLRDFSSNKTQSRRVYYDEAPLQVKNLMKRKSREEIVREGELASLQISRKNFLQDMEMLEFNEIHKSNDLFLSQSPKNSFQNIKMEDPQLCPQKPIYIEQPSESLLLNSSEKSMDTPAPPFIPLFTAVPAKLAYIEHSSAYIGQNTELDSQEEQFNKFVIAEKQNLRREKVIDFVFDFLIDQFTLSVTAAQINQIFDSFNSQAIGIEAQTNEDELFIDRTVDQCPAISADMNYVMETVGKLLQFCSGHINLDERLRRPLGVKTSFFLRCMRILCQKKNIQKDQEVEELDYELQLEKEQIPNYQDLVSQEQHALFQQQSNLNDSEAQSIFNRAIYDFINVIFDTLRPFGKKGRPPICFQQQFKAPSLDVVKQKMISEFGRVLRVQLGFMNFERLDGFEVQKMLNRSWKQFKEQVMLEIEEEYQQKSEDVFEINYDLLNLLEQQILKEEVVHLRNFFFKKH